MRSGSSIWAVVLAGGTGRRLSEVTGGVPKQYWSSRGGPTLLDETLERMAPIAPAAHTTVVVDRTHEPYVQGLPGTGRAEYLLTQPCDRGTAAGVFLGLTPALESGCDPVVLLTPSDHGVLDVRGFRDAVEDAVACVHSHPRRVVLFGAEASDSDRDYGWITPDVRNRGDAPAGSWPVASFVEKPTAEHATTLFGAGAWWNTMVVVARTSSILSLYRRHLPRLVDTFSCVQRLPPAARSAVLELRYPSLLPADFCRDLLAPADGLWARVLPAAVGWSDLGTPDRLRRWISVPRKPVAAQVSIPTSTEAGIRAAPRTAAS
jgi:mannose-1-phosphate guanylyltransferase